MWGAASKPQPFPSPRRRLVDPLGRPHPRPRPSAGAYGTGSSLSAGLRSGLAGSQGPFHPPSAPSISRDFPYYQWGQVAQQGQGSLGLGLLGSGGHSPWTCQPFQDAHGQLTKSLVPMAAASSPGSGRRGWLRTPRAQPLAPLLPSPAPGAELCCSWVPSQALGCQPHMGGGTLESCCAPTH